MQQNIILSGNSNKLDFVQSTTLNLLNYWKTFEILCNWSGSTGDFANFVDILKQCPLYHTERDVRSPV